MNGNRHFTAALVLIAVGLLGVATWTPRAPAQGPAESLSASFRKAAQRARGAVVAIRPLDGARPRAPLVLPGPGRLRYLPFEPLPPPGARLGEPERELGCSGIVVEADRGHILTIDHSLAGASQVAVILPDGRERVSSQIRRDPRSDLAIVSVDPAGLNLAQASWGDPAALTLGDWVLTLGQTAGAAPTLSAGITGGRRRLPGVAGGQELIETDAAVNEVNSGGPLVNLGGEIVGINAWASGRYDGRQGMGWAIPADRARRIAAELIQFGQVRRTVIGVQVEPADPAAAARVNQPGAVVIASVLPAGPAAQAGLQPGDVILRVGQRQIDGVAALQEAIEAAPTTEELPVTVDRQGRRLDVKVRPQAQPNPLSSLAPPRGPRDLLEARRDQLRRRLRGPDQVQPRQATPRQPDQPGAQPPPSATPPGRAGSAPSYELPDALPR
jgi:S1-C subfamily serine protease